MMARKSKIEELGVVGNVGSIVDCYICLMRRLEVSMGGRFGKYGNAKRKVQIRKNRLRPPDLRQSHRLRFSTRCAFIYDLIERRN